MFIFFLFLFIYFFALYLLQQTLIWKILRVLASKCVRNQASKFRCTSHGGGLTTTEQTQAADEGKYVGVGSQVTQLSGNLLSDIDLTLWQPSFDNTHLFLKCNYMWTALALAFLRGNTALFTLHQSGL